ncbi:hypothetical protein LZ30DRAFT_59392 [Colletotrichum cereale]|nr:hypothetical protein LZ30DRAFT_59392 [Colletotrichum cereale]
MTEGGSILDTYLVSRGEKWRKTRPDRHAMPMLLRDQGRGRERGARERKGDEQATLQRNRKGRKRERTKERKEKERERERWIPRKGEERERERGGGNRTDSGWGNLQFPCVPAHCVHCLLVCVGAGAFNYPLVRSLENPHHQPLPEHVHVSAHRSSPALVQSQSSQAQFQSLPGQMAQRDRRRGETRRGLGDREREREKEREREGGRGKGREERSQVGA